MDDQKAVIRMRVGPQYAHYGDNLVDGAFTLGLFGDIATELLIRLDGDEGLFLRYSEVQFISPLYAGDYVEVFGRITQVGKTSRKMGFEAYRIIKYLNDRSQPSAAEVLDPPELYCRATGICVTPLEKQGKRHSLKK